VQYYQQHRIFYILVHKHIFIPLFTLLIVFNLRIVIECLLEVLQIAKEWRNKDGQEAVASQQVIQEKTYLTVLPCCEGKVQATQYNSVFLQ